MSYVARIESNLKGGVRADLAPCTLVVGPNRAGKTALTTALELVLTGRCRDGSRPADLMALAPPGSNALDVTAVLAGGSEARFSIVGSTAKARMPTWKSPPVALLVSEIAEVLSRNVQLRRQALLRVACSGLDAASLQAAVPDVFRGEWQRLWTAARRGVDSDADALVELVKAARAERLAAKKLASEPSEPPASVLAPEAMEQLRQQARAAEARERLKVLLERRQALGDVQGDLQPLRNSAAALRGLRAAFPVYEAVFAAGATQRPCLLCGGVVGQNAFALARLGVEERLAIVEARLAAFGSADEAAALDRAIAEAEEGARGAPEVPSSEIRQRLEQAEAAQRALTAWTARRSERAAAAARQDALFAVQKAAERAVAETLRDTLAAFEARASEGLSEPIGVQLFDGARAVCRVGLRRDGHIVEALSGEERAELLVGLASAWATSHTEPIRLVLLGDVWLDAKGLHVLCGALRKAVAREGGPTQAIIEAVTLYGEPPPEGWHVVDVSARVDVG